MIQFLFTKCKTGNNDLETNHFILIHGGGFGAWCWYKTIALLEEDGFKVTAIDLAGCGINSCNINSIASLSQYVKPLTDVLEKLPTGEKVILVGHDFGGASMLTNGQSTLDMFSLQAGQSDLMRKTQIFIYTNGSEHPPTGIDLDKSLLKDLLFNQSPSKDVALASVSMRSIPFAPFLEKLCLSDGNYGSVRRFYIETLDDNAIPLALQENMINSSPPEKVYRLKGADHAPFFSKPQALQKLLLEIARIKASHR
uniref:AB hydrolase-1 domain-containing protein n=1 Tax=Brassica oleracea var. oleracea TaxID=109376 RepID=A0A0D3AWN1_BRAOL